MCSRTRSPEKLHILGLLSKTGLALNLGYSLTHSFTFCISTCPFLSKASETNASIDLGKISNAYKQAAGKFPLDFTLTQS